MKVTVWVTPDLEDLIRNVYRALPPRGFGPGKTLSYPPPGVIIGGAAPTELSGKLTETAPWLTPERAVTCLLDAIESSPKLLGKLEEMAKKKRPEWFE